MTGDDPEHRFICDRMAGPLCRYLRLMGYDTLSANDLPPGNPREDTLLLSRAHEEERLILTRDHDLSHRDQTYVLYLAEGKVGAQIIQLTRAGLITPAIRLTRCSLCNSRLIPIALRDLGEIKKKFPDFSPGDDTVLWCPACKKAYWEGSHTGSMRKTLAAIEQELK